MYPLVETLTFEPATNNRTKFCIGGEYHIIGNCFNVADMFVINPATFELDISATGDIISKYIKDNYYCIDIVNSRLLSRSQYDEITKHNDVNIALPQFSADKQPSPFEEMATTHKLKFIEDVVSKLSSCDKIRLIDICVAHPNRVETVLAVMQANVHSSDNVVDLCKNINMSQLAVVNHINIHLVLFQVYANMFKNKCGEDELSDVFVVNKVCVHELIRRFVNAGALRRETIDDAIHVIVRDTVNDNAARVFAKHMFD